ncbi:MAG TPA: D-alanyl-D-alanine carboxypeptidase/D-alanyl-D-alanine-endopeptidase [Edaphobacter sp.]|jgi:D-alanyl-D-alanine carboxypeptidase/D-alanyl-D-alanine-endopeptidase (penicillin-binding protein 4)|nr:D-alanyl-D-alanine carboxypeptidase/D-alanyl-D-alanine-endopeptidase [Edaphobacter sp.]
MMRTFVRVAICSAIALNGMGFSASAQDKNVGCDGAVLLKAGRGGPCSALANTIAKLLNGPTVGRDHWGIAVTSMDGSAIYSLNEGQLFQPASNAKLFTTAAAMALLGPDTTFETKVVAKGVFTGNESLRGDLVLVGGGDANLSGREIPYVAPALRPKVEKGAPPLPEVNPLRYLEAMADQVAAAGLKVVNGDVVGDDSLFPWEPYPQDWSIDDAVWGYGAPVSALTINDNQIKVTVKPAVIAGEPATVVVDPGVPSYYTLDVSVTTSEKKSGSHVQMERALGSKVLRVYGTIALDSEPDEEEVAIHDPAEYAAMALKGMLEARGIVVTGKARAQHRIPTEAQGFLARMKESTQEQAIVSGGLEGGSCLSTPPLEGRERTLATHRSSTLLEDVVVTNKVSQNLHAELWLHHLGKRVWCSKGSTVEGARLVRAFLEHAGVDKDDFVFFDGSGLSGHDLVTPRATARLLQYATTQPWFAGWKNSLPIGGEDGSLISRFGKAPLKDHVFAKTGTLGEARALSGYLECASGRTVIFSIMVGNHLPGISDDREAMDKIAAAIASAN